MLAQGAEAVLTRKEDTVLKERIAKAYRHPTLDAALRRARTKREAKMLEKLLKLGFPVPKVLHEDDKTMTLTLAFIDGSKVRDVLASKPELAKEIGRKVGMLHANNIIHGDLTTSNMILNSEVFFIDFG
ncbi:MAG TPA: KEOPS complex kinase/ATPase Bud32, partial [Candidatus Binatia bacterium]|nr:KEOPS complex kinase/ATPase Bud32 [Candidatus Binatia bacterium]